MENGSQTRRDAVNESNPLMTVEEIRAVRSARGMSQDKFAEWTGIPVATIRNWEQGRTQPDAPARALLRLLASRNKKEEEK